MKKRIVIFASGSGTNTQNVIQYFQQQPIAEVVLVLTNKKDAQVIARAESLNTKAMYFSKPELLDPNGVLQVLKDAQPDLIVLAGFLLKFPHHILKAFPNKVINIHPALLPKYGGKGMYGKHVHKAVRDNNESETGITIHYVNEEYDEGAIIFQKAVPLSEEETVESIAQKVHKLEYEYLPKTIEQLLNDQTNDSKLPKHD